MAQDLSGHIELWLPALAWVNSDMKAFGDGNWAFDIRPIRYLEDHTMPRITAKPPPKETPYSRCTTPNPTPRVTPLSRATLTSTRPLVNTTPRVWYSTRPASTPGPRVAGMSILYSYQPARSPGYSPLSTEQPVIGRVQDSH
ncbi:secreted protein [Melampsora americana]|nr:secreted protein [Melampsora americana]